jgi:hypothetical protein
MADFSMSHAPFRDIEAEKCSDAPLGPSSAPARVRSGRPKVEATAAVSGTSGCAIESSIHADMNCHHGNASRIS